MTNSKIALITGATSGIGAAFAEELAKQGYDLILTGRRQEKINAVAEKLRNKYHVQAEVVLAELSDDDDIAKLANKIQELKTLDVLINNAGFLERGDFCDVDLSIGDAMNKVHTTVVMHLSRAALTSMKKHNAGTIINVSSIGSFMSFPKSTVYVASKAFTTLFTESLAKEFSDTNIRFQALCPGLTHTDLFAKLGENLAELEKHRSWIWKGMTPEAVVAASLKCLHKNKIICIPGFRNKLNVWRYTWKRLFCSR